jgi:hypothetical protein
VSFCCGFSQNILREASMQEVVLRGTGGEKINKFCLPSIDQNNTTLFKNSVDAKNSKSAPYFSHTGLTPLA